MSNFLTQVVSYLTDAGKLLHNSDWVIILFAVFAVFLVGFTLGRSRLLLALISIYAAVLIESRFIYFYLIKNYIKNTPDYFIRIGLFFALYFLIFFILNRSLLRHRLTLHETSFFSLLFLALLQLGFLASITLSYFPAEASTNATANISGYFTTKNAQLIWAVLPLLAALFLRNKQEF